MSKTTAGFHGPIVEHKVVYNWPNLSVLPKILFILARSLIILALVIVAGQLLYPANRILPKVNFGGQSYGFATQSQLIGALDGLNTKTFTATAAINDYRISLEEIGLGLDSAKIADDLANYPASQRFVPLSFLFYSPQINHDQIIVKDPSKLDAFATKVAEENNLIPDEGTVLIEDGEAKAVYSKSGTSYRAEDIADYLSVYSGQALGSTASIPYDSVPPANSREHLDQLAEQANQIISGGFTLNYSGGKYSLPKDSLAGSIRVTYDKSGVAKLEFDDQALLGSLEDLADQAFRPPLSGNAGGELDYVATADKAAKALSSGQASAAAVIKPLMPDPNGRKLYPATSKGIQQLIQDWRDAHASLGLSIDFAEIAGIKRQAQLNAEEPYFSASVYKVFVAWFLLRMAEENKITDESIIINNWDLPTCLEKMIVISESICSEGSIAKYTSWEGLDKMAAAAGISGIALSKGVSITARGMTQFLQKLDAGDLLGEKETETLLDLMKRQKYRQAIPAGSSGEVADKVGYQPQSYSWHDAAMVYHPKGKYTLVILTRQGASLYTLSDLARRISDTLDR